jgi:hypothetical protein
MRVLKISLLCLVLPLIVAADEEKRPPETFKEVTPKNKAWVAWFPKDGEIDESEDSIVSRKFGQMRFFRTVLQRKDKSLFIASQIILPPQLVKAPPKVRQDLFRDLAIDEFKGKLVEEKKAKLGTMAGKEYLIKTPRGEMRFFLYGTGVQMFRLVVVGTKEQVESKDAETFFNSFKRTPKTDNPDKKNK